jgi:hypothetical protein
VVAPVAATLDRLQARWVRRQPGTFPEAAGASDRDLALLGRFGDPVEVLREARLSARRRVGQP